MSRGVKARNLKRARLQKENPVEQKRCETSFLKGVLSDGTKTSEGMIFLIFE